MRLSVKIMAHKKRAKHVDGLVEQLGITDDDVVWDRIQNRWDTGRRAWAAIDQDADWGCVVQDDAAVCKDFIPAVEAALENLTDRGEEDCVVSPYIGTRRPMARRVEEAVHEAERQSASWVKMPALNWGVAIIVPTRIIDSMLPWCDQQTYPNYDRRIGRYCIDELRMPTMCTWPSLVDHRKMPSLVGHGEGRYAHKFIGEQTSALEVDWSGPIVRMDTSSGMAAYKRIMGADRRFPTRPSRVERGPDMTSVSGRMAARALRVPKRSQVGRLELPPERPRKRAV